MIYLLLFCVSIFNSSVVCLPPQKFNAPAACNRTGNAMLENARRNSRGVSATAQCIALPRNSL